MLLLINLGTRGVSSKGSCCLYCWQHSFGPTIALAQDYRGTSDQRMSCTPDDAFRLCAGYIPDGAKVENCLRQNVSNLSPACRSVFGQGIRSQVSITK
jgi:hypothetical protein